MEKRFASLELRTDGRRLTGHAAVFNSETSVMGQREIIKPGAFAETLRTRSDILALADHDASKVLGRTRSNTLRLQEDDIGLWFDLDLPATRAGLDVIELTKRGDTGGMSFGFNILDDSYASDVREIRKIELFEISVVSAFPAYASTTVNLRKDQQTPALNLRRRTLGLWG